jgi:hypothetical protein
MTYWIDQIVVCIHVIMHVRLIGQGKFARDLLFCLPAYGLYKDALNASKRAELTSSIETCDDQTVSSELNKCKRPRKKPVRLQPPDSDSDDSKFTSN